MHRLYRGLVPESSRSVVLSSADGVDAGAAGTGSTLRYGPSASDDAPFSPVDSCSFREPLAGSLAVPLSSDTKGLGPLGFRTLSV